jgi:5-methyltetrahydropteroyltriglutamate--homocysteine methyltransferase
MKTTIQGSYPIYPGIETRTYRLSWEEERADPFLPVIEKCVRDQIDAGIDIVSDGQTRSDMLRIFTRKIPFIRDLDNVLLVSDRIRRTIPMILDDLRFVIGRLPRQTQTKGILTGPYTLASSCEFSSDAYRDQGELAFDFAKALNREAREIAELARESGKIAYIQIDEPMFSQNMPGYAEDLLASVTDGVEMQFALHVCGDVKKIFERLIRTQVQILDLEFFGNPDLLDFVSGYDFNQKLAYGCVDNKSEYADAADSVERIQERIEKALRILGEDRLIIKPDCGFRNISRQSAMRKMKNMVTARDKVMGVRMPAARKALKTHELDTAGYFYIVADHQEGVVVRHYGYDNVLDATIVGTEPQSVFNAMVDQGLVSQTKNGVKHAGYMRIELEKACHAYRTGKRYVQDRELSFQP